MNERLAETIATYKNNIAGLNQDVETMREGLAAATKGRVAEWQGERREGIIDVYDAMREAYTQLLSEKLTPETLTVHVGAKSYEVEVSDAGKHVYTYGDFAVLAGRTATKTRRGALSFSKLYGPKVQFAGQPGEHVRDQIWAEDSEGNRYGDNGVMASGNKGQYGVRVVGHVSDTEITAKV